MTTETFFDDQVPLYRDAYGRSRDFQARWSVWTGILERLPFTSCLDVGCGAGAFSLFVAERGVPTTGVDLSARMVDACRAEAARRGLGNARFEKGALPFAAGTELGRFDLVLCSSVLEYVEPVDEAIQCLVDATRPSGHLVVSFPNARSWFRRYERLRHRLTGRPEYYQYVRHLFTEADVRRRFERLGCAWRETHYYGDEPWLSRIGSAFAPALGKNLFVSVFQKSPEPG